MCKHVNVLENSDLLKKIVKISKFKSLPKVPISPSVAGRLAMIVPTSAVEDAKNEYELAVKVGVLSLMLLMMTFRVAVSVSSPSDTVTVQDSDVALPVSTS